MRTDQLARAFRHVRAFTQNSKVQPHVVLAVSSRQDAEQRPALILLGKLPPPYLGPSIATRVILQSDLKRSFDIYHVDTRAHESLQLLGKWTLEKLRRNFGICIRLIRTIRLSHGGLVVVPISQSTVGFVKDSVFILISRALCQPVLAQLRGSDLQNWLARSHPVVRWYVKRVLRQVSGVIVLGHNLRPIFRELVPSDRIYVVPNGANYRFPPRIERAEGLLRFLYVANLRPEKGIEDVIDAVVALRARGVDGFHVDIVGEWTNMAARQRCLGVTAQNSLPITFHGPKYDDEKLAFFSAADVFVFVPRAAEGHPWVIVEALAAGLPIVATDRGAIRESVLNGENGFVIESSAKATADAMATFIANPEQIRIMGAASSRHYQANFTEARMVERLRSVFSNVIQNTHA